MIKNAIVLHHSANRSATSQYQSVWNYHNSGAGGKWPKGHGIQYAYFIDPDGTVFNGRSEEETTWHAGNWITNLRSIGICLAGDFTKSPPTDAQIDALTKLTLDIQSRRGISEIILHREVNPPHTSCPGTDLRALVEAHKKTLLKVRLSIAEKALPRVTGPRKAMLTRFIERLRSYL